MLDLTNYKLTLPENALGELSGRAQEITDLSSYNSKWFEQIPGGLIFVCPDGGAVTKTAHYARCELRDLREFAYTKRASDSLRFAVTVLPIGHKVVVQQIHDEQEPWIKMAFDSKGAGKCTLRALVKPVEGGDDVSVMVLDELSLNDIIDCKIDYFPKTLFKSAYIRITAGGETVRINVKKTGKFGKAYFKRGNYYQNADRRGFYCEVIHHG